MPIKPEEIGACIIVLSGDNKKLLLGKRKGGYKAGLYGIPGGRLNLTEKLIDCATRELLEETGLRTNSLEYLGAIRDLQDGYNFIHFAFLCRSYKGEPKTAEPDKCEGWGWFAFNSIPENILAGHKAAIDLFLNPNLPAVRDISSI